MSNNQSSVDWLIEQLTPSISLQQKHIDDLKEKAKTMHKQEIKISYRCGAAEVGMIEINKAEQYYNETFNNNE
jgi:hypothetical protein